MRREQIILIADDQRHLLALLRATASQSGCRVVTVTCGEEALAEAATIPVDLLLIDFDMPGLNGIETVRLLKQNALYANLPIIMITGGGQNRIRTDATLAGVSLFLSKPFSPTELLESIQLLLSPQDGSSAREMRVKPPQKG